MHSTHYMRWQTQLTQMRQKSGIYHVHGGHRNFRFRLNGDRIRFGTEHTDDGGATEANDAKFWLLYYCDHKENVTARASTVTLETTKSLWPMVSVPALRLRLGYRSGYSIFLSKVQAFSFLALRPPYRQRAYFFRIRIGTARPEKENGPRN